MGHIFKRERQRTNVFCLLFSLFREFIYHILRIWFRRIVCQTAGTGYERHDSVIDSVAEGVFLSVDIDVVNASGIIIEQSVNIYDGHAVDKH